MTNLSDIIAGHHMGAAQRRAAQEVNARTATMQPTDPPADARELTFEEVAGGEYPDRGTWLWPESVCAGLSDSYDLGGGWVADAALVLRALGTLYANGYRLVGPPPKAG